jgi:hypothetical protein
LTVLSQEEVIAAMLGNADSAAVQVRLASLFDGDSEIAAAEMDGGGQRGSVWGPELIHALAQDRSVYLKFSASLGASEAAEADSATAAMAGAPNRQLIDELRRGASRTLRGVIGS